MDFAAARQIMVDSQVRVNDVTDHALQAALRAVPRERFCAPNRAFSAYAEVEVEIAPGRVLMMARDVAKLIQALDARPGERALAVAAPYAAAILARMGVSVIAQEDEPGVFDVVGPVLHEAGVDTVTAGADQPHGGGFDILISEMAVATRPDIWLNALRVGGRAAFVERRGPAGKAVLYERGREGVSRRVLFDSNPPVMAALNPAPAFVL